MSDLTSKINAAKQDGYSDDEIITHLSSTDLRAKIEAAQADGYSSSEIVEFLGGASSKAPEVSSLGKQFAAGMESNTELPGITLEQLGTDMDIPGLRDMGTKLRNATSQPEGFVSGTERFMNPAEGDSYVDPLFGFGWGNLPAAGAEVAGQMMGDLSVRAAGGAAGTVTAGPKGAVVGALVGPAVLEFIRVAGPLVRQRMENDGRTEATWEDWVAAATAAGASGILNAIGIKNIGVLNQGLKQVGKKSAAEVVKEAATETGKKAVTEGVTESGQSVLQQAGETAGTEKGLYIDLKQAVGEGILGTAAGGTIDATRNIRPTIRNVNDIRAVDSAMRNDQFAQEKAEITDYVNQLSERGTQDDRELQTREINSYARDLKAQAEELIRAQRLAKADEKALIKGINSPEGLSEQRLNEIAGRSESPDEIKALANRIQLIRTLTVQQQARKGLRGVAATSARIIGPMAGASIGGAIGGGWGAAAGLPIGQQIGSSIARSLSNSQTQGARIDALVGTKQARRARLLLERYGPSRATEAMNTLTEKAAVKKAEAEAEQQARSDFEATMSRIKDFNKLREKSRRAEQQAKTNEERAKARQDNDTYKSAYREARLKAMALKAAATEARNKKLFEDLEAKKSLNALTVEAAQAKADLQRKMAEAKAGQLDRQKQFEIENLKGKLAMLGLDIQKRQEALKKAQIATKRAEKAAQMAPAQSAQTLNRIRSMGSKWAKAVEGDDNIANKPAYMSATEYLDGLRQQAQNTINAEPDAEIRNLLRETLTDLISLKNNWEARRARFNRAMDQANQIGKGAPQKLRDTLYQLAHYKASSQPEGREDFGSVDEDTGPNRFSEDRSTGPTTRQRTTESVFDMWANRSRTNKDEEDIPF